MIELSLIEKYIYENLTGSATFDGIKVEIGPFDLQKISDDILLKPLPIVFFQYMYAQDRNAIGPGPRTMTGATYEISVFHQGNSFGAVFQRSNGGGSVSLLEMVEKIDSIFQDYSTPVTVSGGAIFSVQRTAPVRMSERGPDGRIYKRDGGLYRFTAQKEAV